MKQRFSAEFKIIFAVTVVFLAFITVGVVRQIFKDRTNDVKFVYNSACTEYTAEVNISDIFSEI